VFHSFRHTFETKAVEKKIPTEYQNASGWVDCGVGQRILVGIIFLSHLYFVPF